MRALGVFAVVGAVALATGSISAPASAATVTFVHADGISGSNLTGQKVQGSVSGTGALSFLNDWLEFFVTPSTVGAVTVDVLADPFSGLPSYPGEVWQIVVGAPNGAIVVAPSAALDVPTFVPLVGGLDYYLELASGTPPSGGDSQAQIQVEAGGDNPAAPLPGALALFAGGLGLLGFAGMRRSRKTGRGLSPMATA